MTTVWGADSHVFQWGSFTDEEAVRLVAYCNTRHAPIPVRDASSIAGAAPVDVRVASESLVFVSEILRAYERGIHPGLRFVCFFGRAGEDDDPCNAVAEKLPGEVASNAYAIKFNFEGIAVLREFIDNYLASLAPELVAELPGHSSIPGESWTTERCLTMSAELVFLHELGHVLRKHHDLLNGDSNLRRALEMDADEFAGRVLAVLVGIHVRVPALPIIEDQKPEASWWLASLVASLALFSVLGEGGPFAGGSYHTPFVRVGSIVQQLKLPDVKTATQRLFPHLVMGQHGLVPREGSPGELQLREDLRMLREVTLPILSKLRAEGKLTGWLLDPSVKPG